MGSFNQTNNKDESESVNEKAFNMSNFSRKENNEELEASYSSRADDNNDEWTLLEEDKIASDDNIDKVDKKLVQNEVIQPLKDLSTEQSNFMDVDLTDNNYVEEEHNEYITDSDIEQLEESPKRMKIFELTSHHTFDSRNEKMSDTSDSHDADEPDPTEKDTALNRASNEMPNLAFHNKSQHDNQLLRDRCNAVVDILGLVTFVLLVHFLFFCSVNIKQQNLRVEKELTIDNDRKEIINLRANFDAMSDLIKSHQNEKNILQNSLRLKDKENDQLKNTEKSLMNQIVFLKTEAGKLYETNKMLSKENDALKSKVQTLLNIHDAY